MILNKLKLLMLLKSLLKMKLLEITGIFVNLINGNIFMFYIKIQTERFLNSDIKIMMNQLKKILFAGDCVSVPPGCALGLLPLVEDSILIEISNKVYHDNYEKINLFA